MTSTAVASRVRAVVEPVVDAAGLALEDVTVSPAGRRSVVRVVVDLADDAIGSLGSDALADVARQVSSALDSADPVRGAYVLEVTTPGVDRPLTQPRHFRRARTRLVVLTLADGSVLRGRLLEADDARLQVDTGDVVAPVELADVVRGAIEVEFERPGAEEGA